MIDAANHRSCIVNIINSDLNICMHFHRNYHRNNDICLYLSYLVENKNYYRDGMNEQLSIKSHATLCRRSHPLDRVHLRADDAIPIFLLNYKIKAKQKYVVAGPMWQRVQRRPYLLRMPNE